MRIASPDARWRPYNPGDDLVLGLRGMRFNDKGREHLFTASSVRLRICPCGHTANACLGRLSARGPATHRESVPLTHVVHGQRPDQRLANGLEGPQPYRRHLGRVKPLDPLVADRLPTAQRAPRVRARPALRSGTRGFARPAGCPPLRSHDRPLSASPASVPPQGPCPRSGPEACRTALRISLPNSTYRWKSASGTRPSGFGLALSNRLQLRPTER